MGNSLTSRSAPGRHFVRLVALGIGLSGVTESVVAQGVAAATVERAEPASPLISVNVTDASLESVIRLIASRAGLVPAYDETIIPVKRRVTLRLEHVSVATAFQAAFAGTGLVARIRTTGDVAIVRDASLQLADDISGRVIDSATKAPISGATVAITGTKFSVRTDDQGRFRIVGVPTGSHKLTVRRLGYRVALQTVVSSDGDVADVRFALVTTATQLEGVVTTVTGAKRRIEVGNTIGYINADSLVKEAPITTFSELLSSRVPGLTVMQGQGTVGGNVRLQIRGLNTISGNSQPIVIVDGVRYENRAPWEKQPMIRAGRETVSPLNDLNPNDIESVEVLKGPSAATLYGTDASNGVIVVTTKRGKPGPTRWSFYGTRDFSSISTRRLPSDSIYYGWGRNTSPWNTDTTSTCDIFAEWYGYCAQDSVTYGLSQVISDQSFSTLKAAQNTETGGTVSGGDEKITYYLGANYHDFTGPIGAPDTILAVMRANGRKIPDSFKRPNTQSYYNMNSNFTARPNPKSTLTIGAMYTKNTTQSVDPGFGYNLFSGVPAEYSDYLLQNAFRYARSSQTLTQRFNSHANGSFQLTNWLSAHGTAGIDQSNSFVSDVQPKDSLSVDHPDGKAQETRTRQYGVSGDLGASVRLHYGPAGFTTSAGTQYVRGLDDVATTIGEGLRVGVTYPQAATSSFSTKDYSETVTLGSYVEQQISFYDRFFVTGAIRSDGATGFGDGYKSATYPKADMSWLISREPWLPHVPGLTDLRFKAAYGVSGKQARATAKLPQFSIGTRSYAPPNQQPQITFFTIGNPLLRPERSGESEYGFDLGALDSRLTFEYSRHHRHTTDLIINQEVASGFGTILRNIGLVTEDGTEFSMHGTVVDTRDFALSFDYNRSVSRQKLVKIGDALSIKQREGGYVEGYPLGARFYQAITGYTDINNDGVISPDELVVADSAMYIGASMAPINQNLNINLGLLQRRVNLSASLSRQTGATALRSFGGGRLRGIFDKTSSLDEQFAAQLANQGVPAVSDFTSLGALGVSVRAPEVINRALHASSTMMSLSVSNVKLWTKFTGSVDPRSVPFFGDNALNSGPSEGLPQSRTWVLRLNLDL